ncbi:MAG: hypothetical protein JRD68_16415 [Deltaproteobacteria bacterium]|nr:hypothetical protein [Deltaproteobacteria bacterium]
MKKEKTIIIISVILLAVFVSFIYFDERYLVNEEQKDLDNYAKIIAISLWNFESRGPTEYLKQVSVHRKYRYLTVSDIDQGERQIILVRGNR